MITAKQIKKRYGSLDVLKGIDLCIEKGEIVSIVGKSGAGKSTLLHILGTLEKADTGQVQINGQEVQDLSSKQLALFRNQQIGFVFQFHHLLPEFTAIENVMMPAMIANQSRSKAKERADYLLDLMDMRHRADHKPSEMSGGEQQRVSVARSLINQPAVIFADEPSGNLDSQTSDELHQLFFRLRDELEQTFLIVTHNQELSTMSDRIIQMADGKIIQA